MIAINLSHPFSLNPSLLEACCWSPRLIYTSYESCPNKKRQRISSLVVHWRQSARSRAERTFRRSSPSVMPPIKTKNRSAKRKTNLKRANRKRKFRSIVTKCICLMQVMQPRISKYWLSKHWTCLMMFLNPFQVNLFLSSLHITSKLLSYRLILQYQRTFLLDVHSFLIDRIAVNY